MRMARAAALLLAAMAGSTVIPAAGQQGPAPVTRLFEEYLEGRADDAVAKGAALEDLGSFRRQFVQETPAWIAADPRQAERRRAAAAAYVLELTHARIESDWGRLADLIEWACVQLRTSGPPTPFERAWHVASAALAGRARARLWLLGEYAQLPHQPPRKRPPPKNGENPSPRHLMHALERFPAEPELQLARIVAWTWGRDQEPIRNLPRRTPSLSFPPRLPPQLEALEALEPLFDDPSVGAEAHIRAGMIRFSVGDFAGALRAYEIAQQRAGDPKRRYLAHFLAGRATEALGQPGDAIRQYARALEIIPSAESAAIALSSLQFGGEEREAAVARLAETLARTPPVDPGRLVGYGSFMRWPELREAMRAELRR